MQLFHPSNRQRQQSGYGLLVVMAFMVVLLIVFASVMKWSESSANITKRNNLFNQTENAAESSTENIMAYMMRDFTYGALGSAASYATNFPATNGWPIYFQFSDTNGNIANAATVTIGQVSTSATNLGSQFAGLYGFEMPCTIATTATPLGQSVNNFSATVCQNIQFTLIPLFQFAIFYNMDLEINPGASMSINGHVHSNNAIWATGNASTQPLIFSNYVEAATGVFLQSSTNDPSHSPPRTGNVVFAITNSNPLGNANVLSLPIGASTTDNNPTNVMAILYPPPSAYGPPNYGAAYNGVGTNYLENQADLIITNPPNGLATTYGTNINVYYQNPQNSPNYLTYISPDVPVVTIFTNTTPSYKWTNVNYVYYSYVTNVTYYDYRESATVQALQINVTNLDLWLTNTLSIGGTNKIIVPWNGTNLTIALNGTNKVSLEGTNVSTLLLTNAINLGGKYYNNLKTTGSTAISTKGINSIYAINAVPLTSAQLPAIRMVNGQRLPTSGLTIVTPNPIYVLGSYNDTTNGVRFSTTLGDTTNTYPAALMGDAVTILSTNWLDSYTLSSSPLTSTSRNAANTAVNAATLEGIVPSNKVYYSGGVENFLRLEENWGSVTNTYNGSIVVMFPSQYATNGWDVSGAYYTPPKVRAWGFDLNFNNANLLPPLTPQIKATIRSTWSAW